MLAINLVPRDAVLPKYLGRKWITIVDIFLHILLQKDRALNNRVRIAICETKSACCESNSTFYRCTNFIDMDVAIFNTFAVFRVYFHA